MIGIPTIREYKPFWDSMRTFLPEMAKVHDIEVIEVRNKQIAESREIIAGKFLESDKDYLLFLDDDHSGHTMEMVQALLRADSYVCAMKCYSRFFPHLCTLMDYSGLSERRGKYVSKEEYGGYHVCDLVGFGMTLIKKELFQKLDKPYFKYEINKFEDNYFCEQLEKKGIKPIGCFDFVCTHNGIDDSNRWKLRDKGIDAVVEDIKKRGEYNGERIVISA